MSEDRTNLYRKLALALPATEEKSHFGKPDFRVNNKIFAGFTAEGFGHVKLRPEQQDMLCTAEPEILTPIKGGRGDQGWTRVDHFRADEDLLRSVLMIAWKNVAPKSLQQ